MKRGVRYSLILFFITLFIFIFSFVPSTKAPHDTGWACGGSTNYTCAGDTVCQNGYCALISSCGNAICESSETSTSCPSDCGSSYTCSTQNPSYCTSSAQCDGISGKWCSNVCYYPASSAPSGCTSSSSVCGNAVCESSETSSSCPSDCGTNNTSSSNSCSSSYYYCYDETSCKNAGGNWCKTSGANNGFCSSSCPTCSSTQLSNCYVSSECTTAGGNWCGTWCSTSTCPTCSSSQVWNCFDETSCKNANGNWCKYTNTGSQGSCSSSSCPSTTCSSSSPWNCFDESSCKSASGNWCKSSGTSAASSGWCQSSSCPSYTCSKDSTWYCYDKTSCTSAGVNWCGTYCSSSSCPVCSKESYWNCYDESSCQNIGMNWCKGSGTGYCQSSSCPTCSSSQPWNCYTETECKTASGNWCGSNPSYPPISYWCSSSCPTYTCSKGSYWNCYDESSCKTAGGQWCKSSGYTTSASSGWCSDSCPTCSSSQTWNCYTETECKTASGNWCGTYCSSSSCPTCSSSQTWNCYDETSCTKANGNWCKSAGTYSGSASSGWCSSYSCPRYDCSKESPWNCYDKSACTTAGGQWCGTYCSSSCPVCSTSQLWNCYTQTECSSANGQWCGTYCSSSCPTCSSSQTWNCYDETSCTKAGANWCKGASESSGSGWCSSYSCPTCSSSQQWNCYDESSCTKANGQWCGTYCSSYSCPKCSSSQTWNCYTKSDCSSAGGQWCGTYCSSYSCPSICGNGACESGESSSFCSSDCGKASCPSSITISFDRASYNIGDTVLMSIQTTVPNIFVDIDASIASGGKGYSGSTSLTTDTKGEISYKFPVSSSTPDGIYKVNAKTNVPGCDAVSSSNSITINSGGGYCGDKLCNNKESSNTCPTDCGDVGDGYCPSSKTCSDGKTMPCDKYLGTCHCAPCEFDPGRVPPGCTQSSDSSTAVLRVNCDLSCPPPPSDISVLKQKCIDNGGNPTLKTTYNGCNYFDCNFADEENFYTGPDRCFTEKELEEVNAKCTKLGLPIKIKVHGDCKIASCTQKEENTRCAVILSSERKSIESECKLQGLQLIKKFDEKGCQRLKCGTPDDCDKELPEAAYNDCSLKGGEIIVKKDVNDCITSTKCITPSDERDDAIGDISVLPSKAELTHVALELTEVSIELEKLTEEANKIKDYYGSTDSPKEEIWSRVVSALQTMSKRIEEIQNDLRDIVDSDEITKDNVLTVKASLIGVSNAFDDVLYLMLSSKIEADVREEKECETADECFDRAFRICQPTSFSPDQNTNVKITGLEDGKCILEAELDEKAAPPEGTIPGVGPPYTMTCNVEDYALGIDNPETSIFPYCEGSMLELVKYYKTQESPKIQEQEQIDEEAISEEQAYIPVTGQVIAYLEANHGPRNCVGKLECTKICDKEPYTCIGYIDSWLRTNSGPGGVRSIAELNNFCSSNKEICKEWLLSRGITLQELQQSKSYSTGPITGFAIRR